MSSRDSGQIAKPPSAKAQFAWLKWFPRDFASSTRGWPLAARGAYRELLDAQWDLGTLPADPERLRELASARPTEWRTAWPYIERKFPIVDGQRRNPRLETHREAALKEYEARRQAAERTNQRRWGGRPHAV